jgi:hydroxymethylpyrimidine pyrophosphatase-like HAD family hydrolase
MRYLALCCDYDGTLAHHGAMDDATVAALERVRESGRHCVLVTGRELDDLQRVLPRLDLFERVVAENGALLYTPATREEQRLADPPSEPLLNLLRERGVQPLSAGRSIVATWEPHDAAVLQAIRELGLELQVIFNKGAVMVLPSGVNKATGLVAALDSMGLSPHNAVGVGDAENDHAFLMRCECAVAVANALPAVKETADIVTVRDHGAGVAELVDELLADDLAQRADAVRRRHRIALAAAPGGGELAIDPYSAGVLVVGTSGSGKSTVATGLLERIDAQGYRFVIIDPEGDYEGLPMAATLGTSERAPSLDEATQWIGRRENAVLNLVGLPLADRPTFFLALLPQLLALRARSGQPHWLVIDEAHHLLPAQSQAAGQALPERLRATVLVTVHPELVAPRALAGLDAALVVGREPARNLRQFAQMRGLALRLDDAQPDLPTGESLVWMRAELPVPARLPLIASRIEHRRHHRKYAEGELPPDRSFWFRGPDARLNLRAQNLVVFLQMADGVDDDTWRHHLQRGDYSRWIAEGIKDEALAGEVRRIEVQRDVEPQRGRQLMREAIEKVYTLPG